MNNSKAVYQGTYSQDYLHLEHKGPTGEGPSILVKHLIHPDLEGKRVRVTVELLHDLGEVEKGFEAVEAAKFRAAPEPKDD